MTKKIKNKFPFKFIKKLSPTLVVILSLVALLLIPVPFVKIAPGPLFNTVGIAKEQDVISISGVETYKSKGELNFTTVSETGGPFGRLVLIDAISSWLSPTEAVVPTSDLDPEIIKKKMLEHFLDPKQMQ